MSEIAGRNQFTIKPQAKDYIQDGCVLLLDGIESGGFGKRTTIMSWIDCMSGIGYPIYQGFEFSDKSVEKLDTFQNVIWTLPSAINSSFTIECRFFMPENELTRLDTDFNYICANTSGSIRLANVNAMMSLVTFISLVTEYSHGTIPPYGPMTLSLSLDGQTGTYSLYSNAVRKYYRANSTVNVFGNQIGIARVSFAGLSVYAVRLYDRALTADEISLNSAIDEKRFGL